MKTSIYRARLLFYSTDRKYEWLIEAYTMEEALQWVVREAKTDGTLFRIESIEYLGPLMRRVPEAQEKP